LGAALKSLRPRTFLALGAGFLALLFLAVALDIPVLRQLLGFVYLAFVPGFLLLIIFRLDYLCLTVRVLLSVGLSAAFLLIWGLGFNTLSLALGFEEPLATMPLLLSCGLATVLLLIIAYFRNRGQGFSLPDLSFTFIDKLTLLIPGFFPLLAIWGTHLLNLYENNVLLILLIILIAIYVVVISLYHKRVNDKIFPVVIFLISISILLLHLIRNPHIIGTDVHAEYYLFRLSSEANHWQNWGREILDCCLAATLLPAIYQSLMKADPEYLFRIMYIFYFSLSPLAVYVISRRYIGSYPSFIASVFFMSQLIFTQDSGDARNRIALFFFALIIMVIYNDNINIFNRRLLFIIFSTGVVLSHYSSTYIYIILLVITMALTRLLYIFRKKIGLVPVSNLSIAGTKGWQAMLSKPLITSGMLFYVVAIMFFWYCLMTGEAFALGVNFVQRAYYSLLEMFTIESRGGLVNSAFGGTISSGAAFIPMYLELVFSWLTIFFIAVGVLTVLFSFFPRLLSYFKSKAPINLKEYKFKIDFTILALSCSIIIGITALVPWISQGYDLARTYFMMMVVLSPFFVTGGMKIASFFKTKYQYWLVLAVLIPYFGSTSGLSYQLFGAPKVYTLSSDTITFDLAYIYEQEVIAAKWIGENLPGGSKVYSFGQGNWILMSQGGLSRTEAGWNFYLIFARNQSIDGYVFLIYPNVVKGKVATTNYRFVEIDPYLDILSRKGKIYANGGAEVYGK